MKIELIEEEDYDKKNYWIRIDGHYKCVFNTYEEAKEEFNKAVLFTPKDTILDSKEI
jgi:hypothetical protein